MALVDTPLTHPLRSWTHGMLAAQAAHAATAIIQSTNQDILTQQYTNPDNIPNMRKVVLKTLDQDSLISLHSHLSQHVKTFLWTEQPENIPTAIATAPNNSSHVKNVLRLHNCDFY